MKPHECPICGSYVVRNVCTQGHDLTMSGTGTKARTKTMPYLIWSEEHGKWWRAHSNGYTSWIAEAGRYDQDEADRIVTEANKHIHPETGFKADRKFNEVMIPDPFWPCEGDDL